jgi:hypothetical protein
MVLGDLASYTLGTVMDDGVFFLVFGTRKVER